MAWTNISKPTTDDSFLLKEDTFLLLLETGDSIVLSYGLDWNNITKPTTSWTNSIK